MRRWSVALFAAVLVGCAARSAPTAVPGTPAPIGVSSLPASAEPAAGPQTALPTLGMSAFEDGWVPVAVLDNVAGFDTVAVLDASGPVFAVAVVCVGDGPLVLGLHDGRVRTEPPEPGARPLDDVGAVEVPCPTVKAEITRFERGLDGRSDILLAPRVAVPGGVTYRAVIATAP